MPWTSRVTVAAALTLLTTMAGAATVLAQTDTSVPEETTTTTAPDETTTTTQQLEESTTTTAEVTETTSITVEESTTTTDTSESTTTTATTTTTTVPDDLAITPAATADLGQASAQTLVASLGEVRVTNAGAPLPRTWTVIVSATDFVNASGAVVPKANIAYASGEALPATTAQLVTPGQPSADLAVSLAEPVVAFGGTSEVVDTEVVWNPTLVLTLPSDAGDGQYDGKIIHSAF